MTKDIAITILVFFSCFFIANGQIETKSILLGGQIAYYNSNIKYSGIQPPQKDKNAAFNISIGKAFKENSVYGLNLTYAPASTDNFFNGADYISAKLNQYNLGIFYRQYKTLATDFYFFAEFGAAYIYAKQTNTDTLGVNLETIEQSGGQLFLTPGISYKILKKVHLEIIIPNIVAVQYAVTKTNTPTQSARQSQFLFNTSLNSTGLRFIGIGFHFIL